jgi:hypothetical protein
VLPTERIAHLSYGRSLLRCGISVRPMSQMGHLRQTETLPTLAACPLRPESAHARAGLDTSASCHERTHVPQQTALSSDRFARADGHPPFAERTLRNIGAAEFR